MTFPTSEVIAGLSGLVAAYAAYVADKARRNTNQNSQNQQALEKRTLLLEQRSLSAEHLKGVRTILNGSFVKVKEARTRLGKAATECLKDVGVLMDQECKQVGEKKASEIFNKICSQISQTLIIELLDTTGTPLRFKLNTLKNFSLNPLTSSEVQDLEQRSFLKMNELRADLRAKTYIDNKLDVQALMKYSKDLRRLTAELGECIPSDTEKFQQFFQILIREIEKVHLVECQVMPIFQEENSILERAYSDNSRIDEVVISESTKLEYGYRRELHRTDVLNALRIEEIITIYKGAVTGGNNVQLLVYIGTLLHLLKDHDNWGKKVIFLPF